MQTVWNPKCLTLEFLVELFLHVANQHLNSLSIIQEDLKKVSLKCFLILNFLCDLESHLKYWSTFKSVHETLT